MLPEKLSLSQWSSNLWHFRFQDICYFSNSSLSLRLLSGFAPAVSYLDNWNSCLTGLPTAVIPISNPFPTLMPHWSYKSTSVILPFFCLISFNGLPLLLRENETLHWPVGRCMTRPSLVSFISNPLPSPDLHGIGQSTPKFSHSGAIYLSYSCLTSTNITKIKKRTFFS